MAGAGNGVEQAAGLLGWNLIKGNGGRIIESNGNFFIGQAENGERKYCINAFPTISIEEARFLHDALGELQESSKKLGTCGIKKFLRYFCIRNLIELDKEQVQYCTLLLQKMVFGFGPLDFVLADDEIEEIAIIGTGMEKPVQVFHCRHGWLPTNIFFADSNSVRDTVNKMAACIGRRLTLNSPVLNATLPDGSRLNAAINPVSFTGPSVTIRKFKKNPFTPLQLIENKTFSPEAMAFLWVAMQCDCAVLIAGNTGSGKTSSLNALFSFVPANERIVVVEETPEIRLPHQHLVKLNVVKEQNIAMQNLIVDTLRMRPDRIVVGEVRSSEETKAFIDTLLAGQGKGSYATFHSQSAKEAANRMKALGIDETDIGALDLIIVQRRWSRVDPSTGKTAEMRRIMEITELQEENGAASFNPLFQYDFSQDKLLPVGESKRVALKAMNCFALNRKQLDAEIGRRAGLLRKSIGRQIGIEEFFRLVNSKWN